MVTLDRLVKRFGPVRAVDGVSFTVAKGEVLGFLGPNGAGKSTTMRMLTGFITPSSGQAAVMGHDVQRRPLAAKRAIGYLPEGAPAYGDMSVIGFLRFVAEVRRLPAGAARRTAIGRAIEQAGLDDMAHRPIETLSKGYKRRVGIAQAILHDPPVLILDEPTDGLDPNQKHEVRRLIAAMAAEKAIIVSTHILEEVEAVCSRAIVIAAGRIVADETPARLQARSATHNAVRLTVRSDAVESAQAVLRGIEDVRAVTIQPDAAPAGDDGSVLLVVPEAGRAIAATVQRRLREAGVEVLESRVEAGRLDEVFRDLTRPAP